MLNELSKKIADEAKYRGLWLYDPTYKNWYSPESFMHIFTYANADEKFLKTLQIRHPKDGIEAGFKKLEDLETKLKLFVKLVNDYYSDAY